MFINPHAWYVRDFMAMDEDRLNRRMAVLAPLFLGALAIMFVMMNHYAAEVRAFAAANPEGIACMETLQETLGPDNASRSFMASDQERFCHYLAARSYIPSSLTRSLRDQFQANPANADRSFAEFRKELEARFGHRQPPRPRQGNPDTKPVQFTPGERKALQQRIADTPCADQPATAEVHSYQDYHVLTISCPEHSL